MNVLDETIPESHMGYDLHITRAGHWADSEQEPISAEEWLAFVERDPELIIDPQYNGPYFALWLKHWVGGDYAWFNWFQGAISTKYPDRKTLGKILEIAKDFDAKVQGDEGEVYRRAEDLPEISTPDT
jgi:hypothetical protein